MGHRWWKAEAGTCPTFSHNTWVNGDSPPSTRSTSSFPLSGTLQLAADDSYFTDARLTKLRLSISSDWAFLLPVAAKTCGRTNAPATDIDFYAVYVNVCVCVWWWEHLQISCVGSSRFWIMPGLICHACWKKRWASRQTSLDFNVFMEQKEEKICLHPTAAWQTYSVTKGLTK